MGQVLRGSATTTQAVRLAIQRSEASVRALALRHGVVARSADLTRFPASAARIRSDARRRAWQSGSCG